MAWFRELPVGVLDSLSPEQVLHCNTEEKCVELVKLLPPTQTALLSWVVELMADVVEEEESNKMNARNVAMVFAPNMTQMSDPLTALMHAVQVMNFLKTLILKTLREREDDDEGSYSTFSSSPTLCDELDEVNHHDQQDDENDRDIEKYSGGGSESPKDIDKAAKPEVDNEQLIGASRRHTSIDFHLSYISYSSDDEDVSLNGIEECFLRRLESKAVSKGADENNGSNLVTSNKAAEQLSSSESINGSCKRNDQTSNMKDAVNTKSNEVKDVTKGELILCS